jgi:Uma2 family endonuclease
MASVPQLTYQQFLAQEVEGDPKREFRAGEVFAMAGAGTRHTTITPELTYHVKSQLTDGECRYKDSDAKLYVAVANAIYYPDGMIACPPRYVANGVIDNPTIIFEVVSESSVARDWNLKLADYETLPSLREYVLIDSRKEEIAVFSRPSFPHDWTLSRVTTGRIALKHLNIQLDLDAIYDEWRLAPID